MVNRATLREDMWGDIRERFIIELTRIFCRDENEPLEMLRAKAQAAQTSDLLISSVCHVAGGSRVYVPKLPRCLRLLRDQQIREGFNGRNYSAIGAAAIFRKIKSRHVRRILEMK